MKIYLDNSTTSWPKPATVISAMSPYLNEYGGSLGRSGHLFASKAAHKVSETHELIASLFNCPAAERVMFLANATHALNFAIKGVLNQGDHVIISHMEHNAVYRTVSYLKDEGIISLDIANCNESGFFDISHLESLIRNNTRMIICIHGSNVGGTLNAVGIIGLEAEIEHILDKGITNIRTSLTELTRCFIDECNLLDEISLYEPSAKEERLPLISMNFLNMAPADLASTLDKEYGIMVRPGLHCSPLAHQTIGSFPLGTLRFSFGCFTTEEEIKYALDSLKTIIHNQ